MCLGEMTTQNDEKCVRKLFTAIGKVLTAKEKCFHTQILDYLHICSLALDIQTLRRRHELTFFFCLIQLLL